MSETRRYDGVLKMFIEEAREPDLRRLEFQRWLAEHGRLEHDVAGPPAGRHASARGERIVPTLSSAPGWTASARSRLHADPTCAGETGA